MLFPLLKLLVAFKLAPQVLQVIVLRAPFMKNFNFEKGSFLQSGQIIISYLFFSFEGLSKIMLSIILIKEFFSSELRFASIF